MVWSPDYGLGSACFHKKLLCEGEGRLDLRKLFLPLEKQSSPRPCSVAVLVLKNQESQKIRFSYCVKNGVSQ